jgi:phosphoglucosamine mutase
VVDDLSWHTNGLPGTVRLTRDLGERYVGHLLQVFGGEGALHGLRVVLDCANGAASYLAPEVFRRLGAEVVALNVWPNGSNINVNCGTEGDGPQRAGQAVVAAGADIGFVFDGDADRCKFVDDTGVERDGDYILALLARDLKAQDLRAGNGAVTTHMANLGLDLSLRQIGVRLERTQVGDKWVSQLMRDGGFVLGGEQSGHIILFENQLSTGDGLYTALRMSDLLLRHRPQRFSELAGAVLTKVPQVLEKAPVPAKPPLETLAGVQAQIQRSQQRLGPDTLVNVRYSGTEPLVRVMIQGADQEEADLRAEAQAILLAVVTDVAAGTGQG